MQELDIKIVRHGHGGSGGPLDRSSSPTRARWGWYPVALSLKYQEHEGFGDPSVQQIAHHDAEDMVNPPAFPSAPHVAGLVTPPCYEPWHTDARAPVDPSRLHDHFHQHGRIGGLSCVHTVKHPQPRMLDSLPLHTCSPSANRNRLQQKTISKDLVVLRVWRTNVPPDPKCHHVAGQAHTPSTSEFLQQV